MNDKNSDDDFKGNRLPPFPVDDQTLDMLWDAIHPWEKNPNWERSSVSDFLTMMDRLGGSDPDAVEEVHDDGSDGGAQIMTMRDQCYHEHNVMAALVAEIRRLRSTRARVLETASKADHPEHYCHRCGGPNVSWCAPSPLWNAVMRGGTINGDDTCPEWDGIVCPTCFADVAEQMGVATRWRLAAEVVKVPLETVTPSGRVWNERTWLFEEHVAAEDPDGLAIRCSCGTWAMLYRNSFGLDAQDEHRRHVAKLRNADPS